MAAGDVVVVDVGLQHVGDAQAPLLGEVGDAVGVALGVDDHGDLAVGDEVAAVPQGRGLDGEDVDHGCSCLVVVELVGGVPVTPRLVRHGVGPEVTSRPAWTQAWVPPRTDTASLPARHEQVGGGRAAVPAGADHVDALVVGHLGEAGRQGAEREVDGVGDVALGVLGGLADVHHDGPAQAGADEGRLVGLSGHGAVSCGGAAGAPVSRRSV